MTTMPVRSNQPANGWLPEAPAAACACSKCSSSGNLPSNRPAQNTSMAPSQSSYKSRPSVLSSTPSPPHRHEKKTEKRKKKTLAHCSGRAATFSTRASLPAVLPSFLPSFPPSFLPSSSLRPFGRPPSSHRGAPQPQSPAQTISASSSSPSTSLVSSPIQEYWWWRRREAAPPPFQHVSEHGILISWLCLVPCM